MNVSVLKGIAGVVLMTSLLIGGSADAARVIKR